MDQGGLVALPLALSDHYLFLRCFGRAAGTSCSAPLGEDSHGGGHSGLSKNHQTFQASPLTPRAAADPLDASTIPHQPTAATAAWCRSLPPAARRRPRLGALGGAGAPAGSSRLGRGQPGWELPGRQPPAEGRVPFPTPFRGDGPRDRLLSARAKRRCIFKTYS